MPLFTRKDRIAIAVFGVLILAGWGARLFFLRTESRDELRIIRGAVAPPAPDSLSDSGVSSGEIGDSLKIDINRAAVAELEALPMIGPVKAADIVRWRMENGPFAHPSDLMKVKGIGPKIYERVQPYVKVEKDHSSEAQGPE